MSNVPLIYISGPYRAPTAWGIARNIHRAREAGAVVASLGGYPIIPHSNTAHMDGCADDALWTAGALELMRRCHGVVMIRRWMKSQESCDEHNEARRLGIKIFDGLDEDAEPVDGYGPWGFDPSDCFDREALKAWILALQGNT